MSDRKAGVITAIFTVLLVAFIALIVTYPVIALAFLFVAAIAMISWATFDLLRNWDY